MEIEGLLHIKGDVKVISARFTKRDFILLDNSNIEYPQYIPFELHQDRVKLIENIPPGSHLHVTFDIRGKEWQGKYYVNLVAWKIEVLQEHRGGYGENMPF